MFLHGPAVLEESPRASRAAIVENRRRGGRGNISWRTFWQLIRLEDKQRNLGSPLVRSLASGQRGKGEKMDMAGVERKTARDQSCLE